MLLTVRLPNSRRAPSRNVLKPCLSHDHFSSSNTYEEPSLTYLSPRSFGFRGVRTAAAGPSCDLCLCLGAARHDWNVIPTSFRVSDRSAFAGRRTTVVPYLSAGVQRLCRSREERSDRTTLQPVRQVVEHRPDR